MMLFLRRVVVNLKPPSGPTRLFCSGSNNDLSNAIAELNQEMESVFGEAPSSGLADSANNIQNHQVSDLLKQPETNCGLSHIGSKGEAQMVDISSKVITKRVASASCKVILGKKVFDLVSNNQMEKGDVLSVARIAGICGAKQTSNLIPLCHNINLSHVNVNLRMNLNDFSVEIEGEVGSSGKTGVEMEALTAVTVAGLTVYDMCKAGSKDIVITDVKLEAKSGGKSGDWYRNK